MCSVGHWRGWPKWSENKFRPDCSACGTYSVSLLRSDQLLSVYRCWTSQVGSPVPCLHGLAKAVSGHHTLKRLFISISLKCACDFSVTCCRKVCVSLFASVSEDSEHIASASEGEVMALDPIDPIDPIELGWYLLRQYKVHKPWMTRTSCYVRQQFCILHNLCVYKFITQLTSHGWDIHLKVHNVPVHFSAWKPIRGE